MRSVSNRRVLVGAVVLAAAVMLSGCGEDGPEAADPAPTTTTTTSAASDDVSGTTAAPSSEEDAAPGAVDPAEWQLIEVTDTGGETFTIADLAGRPVFVENFATWCSNCRSQLADTQAAAAQAGDDAVFLALSVETELDLDDMADYRDENGFDDIRFAVMSPEMLAAMDDAFGTTALNPPSTPKVAVAADGAAGDLVTGSESSEQILSALGLG